MREHQNFVCTVLMAPFKFHNILSNGNVIKYILCFTISIILLSCTHSGARKSQEAIVKDYIDDLNKSDFSRISEVIHDSIMTIEGGLVGCKNKSEFYTIFQWDSVFSPVYKIKSIEKNEQNIEAIISKECDRIRFLHDSATVYRSVFEFQGDMIVKISNIEDIVFDLQKWVSRRDTLVNWIDQNYPDLSGFVFDQTMQGAKNYLKAISLYNGKNVP